MDAVDKIEKMKCTECGFDAEYYWEKDVSPICKDCLADILIDECNDVREIEDLDDCDEDDVELINKLWDEQAHKHKK